MRSAGSICPVPNVGVPVGAGVERVAAVVGVHQVDAAGDRQHPLDDAGQLLAAGVARGRCRGRSRAPYSPTASHSRASRSKRRAIALSPPAVFSIRIGSGKPPSSACARERLAPVVDADRRVVAGVDVAAVHDQPLRADLARPRRRAGRAACGSGCGCGCSCVATLTHVRRVDVDRQVAGPQRVGLRVLDRLLPALRVGEEELDDLGACGLGGGNRVGRVDVRADDGMVRPSQAD